MKRKMNSMSFLWKSSEYLCENVFFEVFSSIEKDNRIVKRKTQSLSVNEVFVAFL